MRGLSVPDTSEDFTADQVELYFDLAFVFAFSQLVGLLIDEHSMEGVARAGLLFTVIWFVWSQFTWSANATSSSTRTVRALFLVATAASIPMAASVRGAYDDGGFGFTISAAVIIAMVLVAMASATEPGSELRRTTIGYAIPTVVVMTILVVGAFFDGGTRVGIWIAGSLLGIYITIRAGESEWVIRSGHFAERHGLIVIIALGEVIVALGIPVVAALEAGEGLPGRTIAALVAAGTFAGLLWWAYFDRPAPAFEHKSEITEGMQARGRFARDVYTYCHYFIVGGVIMAAAALEEITLHPKDPLDGTFRWILFIGLAMFLGGIGAAAYRAWRAVAWERVGFAAAIAVVIGSADSLDGFWLLVVIDALLAVMLVVETLRISEHEDQPA